MDFYKILNENECHHKLQYKFGLNIDRQKFNPSGDCTPGGIYFSREDIFTFLDWGPWIRKVTLPEDAQIYENPGKPKKWKADKVILGKKEKINLKVIKRLIDEGADPTADDNYLLNWAALNGRTDVVKLIISIPNFKLNNYDALERAAAKNHINIVKLLIPLFESKLINSYALSFAAKNGHIKIVKLLLPLSNPKTNMSSALRNAAYNGHTEIVKLLIPVSDPKASDSEALRKAAMNNHNEVVKLLIPVSDCTIYNSMALRWAAKNENIELINLLLPVSEINDIVIQFCTGYYIKPSIIKLITNYSKI